MNTRCLLVGMMMFLVPVALVFADQDDADSDAVVELVWPPKPLPTRIRYVGSIESPADVKPEQDKGFWARFWEVLHGPEEGNQAKPMAVVVDSKGRMSVVDPAGQQVHVYDQKEGDYRVITDADLPLLLPIALAIDDKDNLYVVDGMLQKVCVFSPDGDYLRSIGSADQLKRPTGIAIDTKRRLLYVVDTPQHDIKVFNLDDGSFRRIFGTHGRDAGEFNYPTYAAVDREGHLYINDTLNGRIQIFDQAGVFIREFGEFGDGGGDFSTAKGIAVDSDGNIYVADAGFDNLQIFDPQGRLLLFIGTTGQAPGEFWTPTGLFIDNNDRLYVADSFNKRVQIFQYLKAGVK
ncbi:hypothetical protein MNBD_GAMMA26-1785 [hydrothermal vent metagenome]|uniref:SMP-30/Gluconolactonase/LRE-like region domain-containing protein n=1 Tax=hydrothermal vent metagenome TaxID=652676 RepID=A0A3B1B482_9ZZZZ